MDSRTSTDTLFRHKRLLAGALLIALAGGVATALLLPKSYDSEMAYLVRSGSVVSENVIAIPDITERDVGTEIQLLTNPEALREVARKCGLAPEGSGALATDRAVEQLQRQLRVNAVPRANLIRVRYSDTNRARSQAVLQALSETYLERRSRIPSHSGPGFYDGQARKWLAEIQELEARMAAFRERSGVVAPQQEESLQLQRLIQTEAGESEVRAALAETRHHLETLRQQLATADPRVTTQVRTVPNQYSVERLTTMLAEMQNRRTELLTKFQPSERVVQEVDREIADTRATLERAQASTAVEQTTDLNTLRSTLENDLARAESSAAGLLARADTVSGQVHGYRTDLRRIDGLTVAYDELQRTLKQAEENYVLYSRKAEEARIASEVQKQRLLEVDLVEPPREPARPSGVPGVAIVSAFLLAGALLMSGVILAGAKLKRLQTPAEVEGAAGIPVVATVAYAPESDSETGPHRTRVAPIGGRG